MDKTPKRFPIAMLKAMKKLDVIGQKTIDVMRAKGLVVEPRKKEIRYVPGTTLIPHFAFKNASTNEMTTEAVALKFLIEKTIKINTVSKKDHEDAVILAQQQEDEVAESKRLETEKKRLAAIKPPAKKVIKKTTAKK